MFFLIYKSMFLTSMASLARYIFRTFTFKATIIILYYVVPWWLFIDTETDDLE